MFDEQEILNMMKDYTSTIHNAASALDAALNILTTPTPELPDKPGYYLTQQNRLLLKDEEGDWSARGLDGSAVDEFWEDEQAFARDSAVIVSMLGDDAFPLVPLSEVILPSEHIKEDEED